MLSNKLQDALNGQLNAQLYSSYIYFSVAAYFDSEGLDGFARFMHSQSQRELVNAMKFHKYLSQRGGEICLAPIEAPPTTWPSPITACSEICRHEERMSGLLSDLVSLATEAGEHATAAFCQPFLLEQIEIQAASDRVSRRLRMVCESPHAILALDWELSGRSPQAESFVSGD